MRRTRALIGSVALASLGFADAATAQDLTTSFEFTDTSGDFTLGTSPTSVRFLNGEAKTVGNFSLYRTGFNAWMIDAGLTGEIIFETPAANLELFAKDQFSTNNGVLTLFDEADQVIRTVDLTTAFQQVSFVVSEASPNAVKRITLANNGASGYSVIDDFSFSAEPTMTPIDDPIPGPIPASDVHIRLVEVASGVAAPNWATSAPGIDDRLFVVDQTGIIWNVDLVAGTRTEFLDASSLLVPLGVFGPGSFDERGLLGLAFHPDYATNGLLYTFASEPVDGAPTFPTTMPAGEAPDHQSVVREWVVASPTDPDATPGATSRVVMRVDQPQFNHNAGCLNFGPDGMLYIALGDGGGADDQDGEPFIGGTTVTGHGPAGNGQDPSNPLGTILRIDPTKQVGPLGPNGEYTIPPDNPLIGDAEALDEIFAFGFRNPFRFSFDSVSGSLFAADVGQNDIEEINVVETGGKNFGWRWKEGTFFFDPNGADPGFVTNTDPGAPAGLIDPIAQYDHDEGLAIIGGFVYRGGRIPPLQGRYVFGDFAQTFSNDGRLFHLDGAGEIVEFVFTDRTVLGLSLLGMGQGPDGEVYALVNSTGTPSGTTGAVLRIETRLGDLNADGAVDGADLGLLLGVWGSSDPSADLDGSGVVDGADLGLLLGAWD